MLEMSGGCIQRKIKALQKDEDFLIGGVTAGWWKGERKHHSYTAFRVTTAFHYYQHCGKGSFQQNCADEKQLTVQAASVAAACDDSFFICSHTSFVKNSGKCTRHGKDK